MTSTSKVLVVPLKGERCYSHSYPSLRPLPIPTATPIIPQNLTVTTKPLCLPTVKLKAKKFDASESLEIDGGGTPTSMTSHFNNHSLMPLVSPDEFEMALQLKPTFLSSDNQTYSILVGSYCKKNEPTEARSVLDKMLDRGFEPNVATFTTLINSFCKIGRLRDAYEVFDIMSRIGCNPTINTYNCLLKGLCYVGRVEEAYELMESIKKSAMKPDIYTYTGMMDGFCKVGRSTEASELLYEALEMGLTPNVVTYNTLFNSYFKEGKPLRGFGVLRHMKKRKCKPDYICYSTLLHGLLKWGKIRASLQVYKEMVKFGFRVDERMMNTLLRGLCRQSRKEKVLLKDAYSVFEEMRNGKYTICQGAYDLVLEAFCCGGKMDRVFKIMEDMVRIGHSPKTFTFNIVIHGLCTAGAVDKALVVLMLMHNNRKHTGVPFNLLIHKLNQQQRFLEASNVYVVALKRGVVPDKKPRKWL